MSEQEVTPVTRNNQYAELRVAVDVVCWIGMVYFFTHPDAFDRIPDIGRGLWRKLVHKLSVWTARQDIRSLPETEE